MPSLTFNIIFRTANLEDENFQDRYKTIINDMRLDNPLRFQFICVYLFRRAVYAGIFVFFVNSPIVQVVSAIWTVIAMLLYLIIIRPYQSSLSKILSLVNDLLLLLCLLITIRFLDPIITPKSRVVFGQILITIILATIGINWVGIIISGIIRSIQKFKKKKQSTKNQKMFKQLENKL